jgi:hypothetical protein
MTIVFLLQSHGKKGSFVSPRNFIVFRDFYPYGLPYEADKYRAQIASNDLSMELDVLSAYFELTSKRLPSSQEDFTSI